jgi:hypothetical protein
VALVIASLEFLWNVEKIAIEEKAITSSTLHEINFYLCFIIPIKKISPWDAFKSELSFAFNIWMITKPVRSRSSEGMVSRKSSLKSRSRFGSESRSLKNKSTRSLNFDDGIHESNSRSLLNLH